MNFDVWSAWLVPHMHTEAMSTGQAFAQDCLCHHATLQRTMTSCHLPAVLLQKFEAVQPAKATFV